jgi:hypothetical protein
MDLDDMVGVAAIQQHGAGSANFCHSELGAVSGLTTNRAKKRGAQAAPCRRARRCTVIRCA